MEVPAADGSVGVMGPLMAIACDSCQNGVRNPLLGDALIAIAQYAVPITVLGTATGISCPAAVPTSAASAWGLWRCC
ncbi:hypothetical protein ACWC2K_05425 [Streptomyces chattanoogensis]